MKILVETKDSEGAFVLKLLNRLPFTKAKALTAYKADVLEGIQEAVAEVNLIKEGKLKGRPAMDLVHKL